MKRPASTTGGRILLDVLVTDTDAEREPALQELAERLRRDDDLPLHRVLVACAGEAPDRREVVTDFIGRAARALAPDEVPPASDPEAGAFYSLVTAVHDLHGGGAYPVGRPSLLTDQLLASLVDESRLHARGLDIAARRETAGAGDVLAALAVSRQMCAVVSSRLATTVEPTFDALYEYDPPGTRIRTHVDARGYPIVLHLLVEQPSPRGADAQSTLVVHEPGVRDPRRITLRIGDALVLRGRGTIHSWEPLGTDERRTLVAIGYRATD